MPTFSFTAPFLAQFYKDQQTAALPYVDIIFGNETVSFVRGSVLLVKFQLIVQNFPNVIKDFQLTVYICMYILGSFRDSVTVMQ